MNSSYRTKENRDSYINSVKEEFLKTHPEISETSLNEYAKMFYMFSVLVGCQVSANHKTAFALTYQNDNENENRLNLEIVSTANKPKSHLLPSSTAEQFDLETNSTRTKIKRVYVDEILRTIFTMAHTPEDGIYQLSKVNTEAAINAASSRIGMQSRRGSGNVLIVDWRTVDILRDQNFGQIERENHLDEINSLDVFLRYEFTINNHLRVFSTARFNIIREQESKDCNAILLYNGVGSSTDSSIIVGIDKIMDDHGNAHFNIVTLDDFERKDNDPDFSRVENYVHLLNLSLPVE